MDKEGEKLCDARYASNLNVIGEWLYYICQEGKDQYNQVIRRMKTDGSNMEILYENDDYTCKRMVVVEDQIIFQTVSMDSMGDTETLYCMGVDGGEPTALLDEESYFYGIDGNYVYYFSLQMDENTIPDVCRMDLKTKKPEVVLEGDDEGGVATNLAIEDGWLYYAKATGGETLDLSRINLETGESVYITAIANTNYEGESPINVKDGWIYFNDVEQIDTEDGEGDTISKVMKVKADGSGETKVTDSVESASIFTCGDQVFCATADKKIFVWNEDDLHFNWERIPQ